MFCKKLHKKGRKATQLFGKSDCSTFASDIATVDKDMPLEGKRAMLQLCTDVRVPADTVVAGHGFVVQSK